MLGELEMGWRLLPQEFVAVTGSNGKTTTVELIGHIHREAGMPVIRRGQRRDGADQRCPGTLRPDTTVVCEASSFQLEDTLAFAPEAAVLLNLTEDHLDRHGTMADYTAAKLRDLRPPARTRRSRSRRRASASRTSAAARAACASAAAPGAELSERAGELWWDEQPLMRTGELGLRGRHNVENAMAAAAVTLARGVDPDAVRTALQDLQRPRPPPRGGGDAIDGVLYVNDSKATNVASATTGIESFPGGVHVILGGRAKGGGFAGLLEPRAPSAAARRT